MSVIDSELPPNASTFAADRKWISLKILLIELSGFCCLLALSSNAMATSIFLVPTSDIVFLSNGDVVSFDVVADFSGEGASLGGGLDIVFDPDAISFVNLTDAGVGDAAFSREPDILENVLESWSIGQFDGFNSEQVVIGNVEFRILSTMSENTMITVRGTDGIGGHWISRLDFTSALQPDYNEVRLSRGDGLKIFEDSFETAAP